MHSVWTSRAQRHWEIVWSCFYSLAKCSVLFITFMSFVYKGLAVWWYWLGKMITLKWIKFWFVLFTFQQSYKIKVNPGIKIKSAVHFGDLPVHPSQFKQLLSNTIMCLLYSFIIPSKTIQRVQAMEW